jgi:hypothetical protein
MIDVIDHENDACAGSGRMTPSIYVRSRGGADPAEIDKVAGRAVFPNATFS